LKPILCYVESSWAYFTTQPLDKQWGDDWNDSPYEHNAGEPYTFDEDDGKEPWEIIKVAWDGEFDMPCTDVHNSTWSVERINAGGIAWLQTNKWRSGDVVVIPAGTTIDDFCALIAKGGGNVYFAKTEPSQDQ